MSEPTQIGAKSDRLKRLRRLIRQRQARSEERAFVAEGPVLVVEALAATGVEVLDIYAEDPVDRRVERAADAAGIFIRRVQPGALSTILDTVSPQPVCAVVRIQTFEIVDFPVLGAVLVLAEIRDPGNMGTLIRTAEAAGFVGVVVAGDAVDPTNPKVVRSAAGAIFRLPLAITSSVESAYAAVRATGREVVATVVADGVPYDQIDLANVAIVLGNEAHGLSAALASLADVQTTIPLAGPTESLNVAAAGAVLCFESLRQRRVLSAPPQDKQVAG